MLQALRGLRGYCVGCELGYQIMRPSRIYSLHSPVSRSDWWVWLHSITNQFALPRHHRLWEPSWPKCKGFFANYRRTLLICDIFHGSNSPFQLDNKLNVKFNYTTILQWPHGGSRNCLLPSKCMFAMKPWRQTTSECKTDLMHCYSHLVFYLIYMSLRWRGRPCHTKIPVCHPTFADNIRTKA
jgi:hypothetical protein